MFTNRLSYTAAIHEDAKTWVAGNIERWKDEKPDWFKIEMIPDDFLPSEVLAAEGGTIRRKGSFLDALAPTAADGDNNDHDGQ